MENISSAGWIHISLYTKMENSNLINTTTARRGQRTVNYHLIYFKNEIYYRLFILLFTSLSGYSVIYIYYFRTSKYVPFHLYLGNVLLYAAIITHKMNRIVTGSWWNQTNVDILIDIISPSRIAMVIGRVDKRLADRVITFISACSKTSPKRKNNTRRPNWDKMIFQETHWSNQ